MRTTANLWIAVVALLVTVGCGNNNDNSLNIKFEPDSGVPDMNEDDVDADNNTNNDPDMSEPGDMGDPPDMPEDMGMVTRCGGVVCEPGFSCQNNVCILTSSCGSAHDLGVLPFGNPQVIEDSLATNGVADLAAACIGDEFTSGRDRVFRFELEQTARVEWTFDLMGQYDAVVELRTDCEDVLSAVECEDNESGNRVLDPGEYFLVLDQKFGNAGAFTLTVTATAADCTPGTRMCDPADSEILLICQNVDQEIAADCPTTCDTGTSSCEGVACNNAILGTGGGTYEGDGRAFVPGNLNFENNTDCSDSGDPGNPIPTPGYEVIVYLPGLTAGEIISIDAETNDTNINAIFITQQCGDTGACAAAYRATERPDWVVTANGNYYVIIEKRSPTNNRFEYSVDVL